MRTKIFFLSLVLIGLLIVTGCAKPEAAPTPTAAKEAETAETKVSEYMTAKQALAVAQKAVPSDAYPYIIKERSAVLWSAKFDGTSKNWTIVFYAPSQDKRYEIDVIGGEVKSTFEGAAPSSPPNKLPDGWMDSSEVANLPEVKSRCSGTPEGSYFFGIYATYTAEEKATWQVGCGESGSQITIEVDAVTGEYLGP